MSPPTRPCWRVFWQSNPTSGYQRWQTRSREPYRVKFVRAVEPTFSPFLSGAGAFTRDASHHHPNRPSSARMRIVALFPSLHNQPHSLPKGDCRCAPTIRATRRLSSGMMAFESARRTSSHWAGVRAQPRFTMINASANLASAIAAPSIRSTSFRVTSIFRGDPTASWFATAIVTIA